MQGGLSAGALSILLLALCPSALAAHPLLEEARSQADAAAFQQALLTLARAESESQLTRDDLVTLYLQRALVHFALQIPGAMLADLERVAALEPNLELDASIPPGVREAFPAGEPLVLRVRPTASPGHVRLRANAEGMRTDMVQSVLLSARLNRGEWITDGGGQVELSGSPGDRVDYYAVAFGPGGAEVAAVGSRDAPLGLSLPQPQPTATSGDRAGTVEDEASSTTGWWIAGGVLAAVTAAVVIGLAAGGDTDRTQLSGPEVLR